MAAEFETIFEQVEVGDIFLRARGFDFRDNRSEVTGGKGLLDSAHKIFTIIHGFSAGNACRLRNCGEIGAGRRGSRKPADRKQTFVIENNVEEIARTVARQRGEGAKIHQYGAIAIQNDDSLFRQREGKAKAGGRGESHGVLEVKKVWAMSE